MLAKWAEIGDGAWRVVVYYDVTESDMRWVVPQLEKIGVEGVDLDELRGFFEIPNRGLTVSDSGTRMSVVCIGWVTDRSQRNNSIVHEIDHVQRDCCRYYGIVLGSEEAAYVQGELAEKMILEGYGL